jgi:hypothetical protein
MQVISNEFKYLPKLVRECISATVARMTAVQSWHKGKGPG